MGAYLSEPKTQKDSIDLEAKHVRCGASSMQGWRTSQEDAHNCILEFDTNASLFAVYDGHGSHEVAEYCSKKLPDFIKKDNNYVKGNYEQALKDAFLNFDSSLTTPEVVDELKKIINTKEGDPVIDPDGGSDSESEEAIDNLVQEAHMPLDEVIAKYKVSKVCRGLMADGKPPVSPMLRARRNGAGCSSSSAGPSCSSSSEPDDTEVSSSSGAQGLCNGNIHMNGELCKEEEEKEAVKIGEDVGESEKSKEEAVTPEKSLEKKLDSIVEKCEADCGGKKREVVVNGESLDVSSSTENKQCTAEKGDEITSTSPSKKKKRVLSAIDIYQKLLQCDSDSEEDETFVADAESDDSSDDAADCTGSKTEECEEDSSDDDEEEDEDEEDDSDDVHYSHVPGSDSGSTAVVALLVGNQLYVANAGDSRCVVGRNGLAVEMSFDHKPEDEPERKRIEAAGGTISYDGRVNNGLNLSRAIGDHAYKQSKDLPASEQMISALPDVKTLTIDPTKDNFMVIACDGIWNSMSSQEVVSFVQTKLQQKTERLSQICEEETPVEGIKQVILPICHQLFDHCLAPHTLGDGTGCDNMTCIIVQFKSPEDSTSLKRSAEETEEPNTKRSKIEEEVAPSET